MPTPLHEFIFSFRKQKELAEKAFLQLDDPDFFRKPGEFSNRIAAILKHVAGNLASRWADFLTTDGEKPGRDRDAEFVITDQDTREKLMQARETGWAALFQTLGSLQESDLDKCVWIRGETHTVFQAILRSLTHTAYHTGQMVYLARLLKKEGWEWITIAPGQSQRFTETMHAQGKKYLG